MSGSRRFIQCAGIVAVMVAVAAGQAALWMWSLTPVPLGADTEWMGHHRLEISSQVTPGSLPS